jgi:hypothetical protein
VKSAVLDRAARLRQPPFPGAAGARPWVTEAVALAAAVASGVAAAIHAAAIGPHLEESGVFAAAFAAMAIAQGGWMGVVLVRPSRRRYQAGGALNGAVVIVWLLSRTAGLPFGPHPGVAEPAGVMDATATVAELLAVLGSLVLVSRIDTDSARLSGPALPSALIRIGFGLLVSGFAASLVSAAPPGGQHLGSHACCEPGAIGHLVILSGMLATLAGVLTVAVRGGSRSQRIRRTS